MGPGFTRSDAAWVKVFLVRPGPVDKQMPLHLHNTGAVKSGSVRKLDSILKIKNPKV